MRRAAHKGTVAEEPGIKAWRAQATADRSAWRVSMTGEPKLLAQEWSVQGTFIGGVPPHVVPAKRGHVDRLSVAAGATLTLFQQRVQAYGGTRKTAIDYCSQMRVLLAIAQRLSGKPVDPIRLIGDAPLLAACLIHSEKLHGTGEYSGWAIDQRRHAARRFAALFGPELRERYGNDGDTLLDRALHLAYRRVGTSWRSSNQLQRRRGGQVLQPAELVRLLRALGQQPGWEGQRNQAMVLALAQTGCRINGLRMLDTRNCYLQSDGRLRLLIDAKGRMQPIEYELSLSTTDMVLSYINAFNSWARCRPRVPSIQLGRSGPAWRGRRDRISYSAVRHTLLIACSIAGLPPLRLHDLRRTFATQAENLAGRYATAQAGWWNSTVVMDRHYISPHPATIEDKLRQSVTLESRTQLAEVGFDTNVEALVTP